jgi:hypothetical protein
LNAGFRAMIPSKHQEFRWMTCRIVFLNLKYAV